MIEGEAHRKAEVAPGPSGGPVDALVRFSVMTWTVDRMKTLAQRFDERVRLDVTGSDVLIAPAQARGSVLRAPASEEDIERVEERLEVRFPPSYRAFLLVSNGAYAS